MTCSVDLPAQAILSNMKHFNGAYACVFCAMKGVPRPNNARVQNWLRTRSAVLRTHKYVLDNCNKAVKNGVAVSTILKFNTQDMGASVMCLYKHFDLSKGFSVDALH